MDCDKTEITSNKPEKAPARVEAGRNLANYNKRVKVNQQQQPLMIAVTIVIAVVRSVILSQQLSRLVLHITYTRLQTLRNHHHHHHRHHQVRKNSR